ncbi:MAG: hypothetical protein P4L46_21420 [Fimbriimonas sp.]|nr:hypothetical protein [Fimbriimonas sp.]
MIPSSDFRAFVAAGDFSRTRVEEFAKEIGIAPGIVVGRLQHDQRLPFVSPLNSLKVTFRWVSGEE